MGKKTLYDQVEEDETRLEEELKTDEKETDKAAEDTDQPEEKKDEKPEENTKDTDVGDDADQSGDEEDPDQGREKGAEEEQKPEEKPGEESVITDSVSSNAAFARMRRENAALQKKLQDQTQQPAQTQTPEVKQETKAPADPEPDRAKDYESWLEWKDRQVERRAEAAENVAKQAVEYLQEQRKKEEFVNLTKAATEELNSFIDEYKQTNPDFDNAFNHGYNSFYSAIKITNPRMSKSEIVAEIDKKMLSFASEAVRNGLNPAEELYGYSQEHLGYVPKGQQEEKQPAQGKKSNLRLIENNKKRSATPLSGGGQSGVLPAGLSSIQGMSLGDFSKLTPAQLNALEQEAESARG